MIIPDKKTAMALYSAGRFGGGTPMHIGMAAIQQGSLWQFNMLRYMGANGACDYPGYGKRLSSVEVHPTLDQWLARGADPNRIIVQQCIYDDRITIQGEVMRSTEYISLRYSTLKVPMREALSREQHHVGGLRAKMFLEHYLDADSWRILNDLFDDFDGHVIEFSACDGPITEDGRNCIVWEVRGY